nr:immunoglobulin light chain junction region [Macaca mulatta]MOW69394.1 immunoglobulin light chain junction region [Macaca mulatta]MOW70469.1 immunoglobulin light chain junction region [Macaca mulatta]
DYYCAVWDDTVSGLLF